MPPPPSPPPTSHHLAGTADDKTTQLGPVVAELLSHVVAVLEDDLAREAYGKIYIQALCKVLEVSATHRCGDEKSNRFDANRS